MANSVVPYIISPEEIFIRIIVSVFHYSESKGKLKDNAFIPRKLDGNKLSMNRLKYFSTNGCKQAGIALATSRQANESKCNFIGLVGLSSDSINNISKDLEFVAITKASPLDISNIERIEPDVVYTHDAGNPSHGSIVLSPDEKDYEPFRQDYLQKVIKPLTKLGSKNLFKDEDLSNSSWCGDEITLSKLMTTL